MFSVPISPGRLAPTNLAPLPALLAYAQSLGSERLLQRVKRGLSALAAASLWLVLAWRGSGRPDHLDQLDEPYRTELPRRVGRIWVAIDAHQAPYWGRGQLGRFQKGWSGSHGRSLRGYRVFMAVDTDTGQVLT